MRDASEVTESALFGTVRACLLCLELPGLQAAAIRPESRLIEDIGLDSLKFVDLTVALEDALKIDEFPMQEWVDTQIEAGIPLTAATLAKKCGELVREPGSDR